MKSCRDVPGETLKGPLGGVVEEWDGATVR
jgi:hypothetical protein